MRSRSQVSTVLAVSAASALLAGGIASAATAHPGGNRDVLADTAPVAGQSSTLSPLTQTSKVQVNVFIGRDLAGLATLAKAVSDPASSDYAHYLTTAQVRARFGASTAQQRAVASWLHGSGLTVGYHDGFVVSATGTTAEAEAALQARLELSRPEGGTEQVVSAQAMSVPASVARAVDTVRVAPAIIPMGVHEPMKPLTSASVTEQCSHYYGQKPAIGTPSAYGRQLTWAPCGYLPQQLRSAYGATKSGLTGKGVSIAIMSDDDDWTAFKDANRWAKDRHFQQFRPGQFAAYIAPHSYSGVGDGESALDIESSHGMAPDTTVNYVVGNGKITGDRLLDSLYRIVTYHIADVVSSSWFEGYMPVPDSMVDAWQTVLERAAVEGITVNFATGDFGDETPLQYPGSDPWITTIGGTSIAIGADNQRMWETGWETDEAQIKDHSWRPVPPGTFREGSTGGVSKAFTEPYYQVGVVSHNTINGNAMRVIPDVSDLGDWNLGYQIGLTVRVSRTKYVYENQVNGGTSLASPMFTGFEADLIQGRHGIALGFANPALYNMANTPAFYDVTGDPQGQGVTEAVVFGPAYGQQPTLSTMGQCRSTHHLYCGPGYDTVSGIGTPGPAFFSSFGSHPK
jgi:subtilase family serine protease